MMVMHLVNKMMCVMGVVGDDVMNTDENDRGDGWQKNGWAHIKQTGNKCDGNCRWCHEYWWKWQWWWLIKDVYAHAEHTMCVIEVVGNNGMNNYDNDDGWSMMMIMHKVNKLMICDGSCWWRYHEHRWWWNMMIILNSILQVLN